MHRKAVCLSTASVYAPTFSFQGDKLLEQIRIRVSGRSSEHQESSRQERFVKPQLLSTRARQLPGRPLPRPQRLRGLWPLCPPPARWARSTGSGNLLFKESLAVSPHKSLSRVICSPRSLVKEPAGVTAGFSSRRSLSRGVRPQMQPNKMVASRPTSMRRFGFWGIRMRPPAHGSDPGSGG